MRCIVLALILLVAVIAVFATATVCLADESEEGWDDGQVIAVSAFPAVAQSIWERSLACLKCAEQLPTLDQKVKLSCAEARERLYPENSGRMKAPSQYKKFYVELEEFASSCWSCASPTLSDAELQGLPLTPYWNSTLARRSEIIATADALGIKLVDNTGLCSLEQRLAEFTDGFPAERSADPALDVARRIRDNLLSCQMEWKTQQQSGESTNYPHYYRILCRLYRDAEALDMEPPDGWFKDASMAILATFSSMRAAETGKAVDAATLDRLTTKFQAFTLAWASGSLWRF